MGTRCSGTRLPLLRVLASYNTDVGGGGRDGVHVSMGNRACILSATTGGLYGGHGGGGGLLTGYANNNPCGVCCSGNRCCASDRALRCIVGRLGRGVRVACSARGRVISIMAG